MTAKSVHKNQIPDLGMSSYDGILIQCVVGIVASPSSLNLVKLKERWNHKRWTYNTLAKHNVVYLQKYSLTLTDFKNQKKCLTKPEI